MSKKDLSTRKSRKKVMADDVANQIIEEYFANEKITVTMADGSERTIPVQTGHDTKSAQTEQAAKDAVQLEADQMEIEYKHRFYTYDFDKKGNLTIHPDNLSIIEILRDLGFVRYDQPGGTSEYVQIIDGKLRLIKNTQEIIDAFEDYVLALPTREIINPTRLDEKTGQRKVEEVTGDRLLRQFYKNIMYYFSSTLPRLRPAKDSQIELLKDTRNFKFLFYNNCVVAISERGREVLSYADIDKLNAMYTVEETGGQLGRNIWESNILNRNYYKPENPIGDFQKFCMYICGCLGQSDGLASKTSIERFESLKSIFGYLMHDNYETNLKSILFIDVNKENSGKPAGGTGKGILGKALSCMMNRESHDCKYISVGGKDFDPLDHRRYSNGDLTTQLAHIEDINKNFDFENFFNDVTDGAPFRKMREDKTVHRIKTMLSSNHPIDVSAPSCKRRLVVFELDNYFDAHRTPQDVFGKRFFESQWTQEDWAQFDDFMISCCEYYMRTKDSKDENGKVIGIQQPPLINYKRQLLQSKLSEDFIAWFEEKIADSVLHLRETVFVKTTLFEDFSHKYQEYASREKYARAFTKWCKFYLETMEIPSGEKRSTQDQLILYPDLKDTSITILVS